MPGAFQRGGLKCNLGCFVGVSSQNLFMGRRQAGRCVFSQSEIGRFKDKAQKMGSLQHHVKAIMFEMKSLSVSL
jgi:hypothetical protein